MEAAAQAAAGPEEALLAVVEDLEEAVVVEAAVDLQVAVCRHQSAGRRSRLLAPRPAH